MDPSKRIKDATDSPMRSLSSFKDEIPGGEFPPPKSDDENTKKSFRESLDKFINSAPFHITMLLLTFGHCFLLTAEVILAVPESPTDESEDSSINALASTCLAILSFFVLEVTLRIFSTGSRIFKRRLEVFDMLVVVTTFVLDVVMFAAKLKYDWCRALSYLILLRCWRFYGIYYAEVKRLENEMRTDIEMAKYGRRQAETQADALQSERDAQLKEIFHLREFLHQHNLDPDSKMPDCVQSHSPHCNQPGYSRTVSIDRAETMREETRLYPAYSEESAISSIVDAKQNTMPPLHRHLSTDSNTNEHFDDGEESFIEETECEIETQKQREHLRDSEIEGSEFETQRQQVGGKEEGGEGEESEYESAQEDEEETKEERGKPDEEKKSEEEESKMIEKNEQYEVKESAPLVRETGETEAVGGEHSFSDDEGELGIDNLGFVDDGVFQELYPATEMKENYQDSPSKQSIISSDGVSRNELVSVTEDVNGIPMTSL